MANPRHHLTIFAVAAVLILTACTQQPPASSKSEAPAPAPSSVETIAAELIASDKTWGNTEGPTFDSKNNLYFCARGTYKGIIQWNEKDGAKAWLAVATKQGPGGLWADDKDNIYLTAIGERQILMVTPDKKISVVTKNFEADAKLPTGPNDLVIAKNGTIYFTDPNGFHGEAPNGTVYRISAGMTTIFSDGFTGPNGIILSQDEKTLYASHNTGPSTSKIERFALKEDGSAGPMSELVTIRDCVADGMAVDREGSVWLTCYSFGTAYRVSAEGRIQQKITTEQKAITNCKFGRGSQNNLLYLTSSDMERVTGYIYRAKLAVPGIR
jgi:gluconolactonase